MTISSQSIFRWRLAQLQAHLVVAIVALVVIGGATRVLEAGLACPDWPLCFGSFFPTRQMNLKVFLEWFHRLDAFLVGVALAAQMVWVWFRRRELALWVPWICGSFLLLVLLQGALGALTVLELLPSTVVTAHLACALFLLAGVSGLSQSLLSAPGKSSPLFWRFLGGLSLLSVIGQSLLGARMATTWSAQRCLDLGQSCQWLTWHRFSAMPVAVFVLLFVMTSLFAGGWARTQWLYLISALGLVLLQVTLGLLSLSLELSEPFVTVAHQLVAALLVALLASLTFRRPGDSEPNSFIENPTSPLDPCHG